jgi:high-affinity K+ transport system ATPase subunit B
MRSVRNWQGTQSASIFNALIVIALIPLARRGARYKP